MVARIIEFALAADADRSVLCVRAIARMVLPSSTRRDARSHASRWRTRDDLWFVGGFGLMALIVAFCAFLLGANGGRVREVLFNFDLIWRSRTALIRGFWYNVKLFVVSQILVLIWALLVAVVRQLPGRAFAPVRTLAIAYTDVFRGVPAIIVIYLIVLGFGLAGVPPFDSLSRDAQLFWLSVLALVLVYGVRRRGLPGRLESIHWFRWRRPVRSASRSGRPGCVVIPRPAADRPAAAQRLRGAEGHRARVDRRGHRGAEQRAAA